MLNTLFQCVLTRLAEFKDFVKKCKSYFPSSDLHRRKLSYLKFNNYNVLCDFNTFKFNGLI